MVQMKEMAKIFSNVSGTALPSIVIACLTIAALFAALVYLLLKSKSNKSATTPLIERPVTLCGTMHLRSGGALICQTDDIIEIVTRQGTETMTVSEYEARKAKQVPT